MGGKEKEWLVSYPLLVHRPPFKNKTVTGGGRCGSDKDTKGRIDQRLIALRQERKRDHWVETAAGRY